MSLRRTSAVGRSNSAVRRTAGEPPFPALEAFRLVNDGSAIGDHAVGALLFPAGSDVAVRVGTAVTKKTEEATRF